jgi:hypothetical protein
MTDFSTPDPILDSRERQRFSDLKDEWEEFRSPGFIGKKVKRQTRGVSAAARKLKGRIPGMSAAAGSAREVVENARKSTVVKKALQKAARGGGLALEFLGKNTLSRERALEHLQDQNHLSVDSFDRICAQRSYRLDSVAQSDWKSRLGAAVQGVGTGALGGAHGLALNLATSMLLFMRATQRVALHFGYDAVGSREEQEIASQITLESLHPSEDGGTGQTGDILYRVMQAGEIGALKEALERRTYKEMAERGASELLYVQIRSIANKAAKKALDQAGKDGIQNAMLRKLLRGVSKRLPKRAGRRAVPVVGGLIGGGLDFYYMDRVINGARLYYHKRFLAEKKERVARLSG